MAQKKSQKNPLVSIIIPVYNGEKYLAEAIDSVIGQSYERWELIIVNDASTDRTKEIIRRYAQSDRKIKIVYHRRNKYRAGALNTGIEKAKGKYIAFLDADDIYFSDKTAKQVEFLENHPAVDLVYGNMKVFDSSGNFYLREAIDFTEDPAQILKEASKKNIENGTPACKLLGYKNGYRIIPGCSVMIKKRVFRFIRLDEKLKTSQDYDLWFQIIGQGYQLAKLPLLTYAYRCHPEQISSTKNKAARIDSDNRIIYKLKTEQYFKKPKARPKILLVPNTPNWAFDFEADQIIKHFSHRYEFTKLYQQSLWMNEENYLRYDKIYVFFWPAVNHFLKKMTPEEAKKRLITGVFSYNSWERKKRKAEKIFSQCRAVVVNDKKLYRLFQSKKYRTYYVKKWVDVKHFSPAAVERKKTKKLIVGWSGNPNHVDRNYKGYWNIVKPVCERNADWIELKSALQKLGAISYKNMPKFYNSIDIITCLSKAETGPNSLLEAGACGKPAVSVKAGIASELIKSGHNGFLINRDRKSLENALRQLYQNKNLAKKMGRRTRLEIKKNWTCEKNIKPYQKIFDY